MADPRVTRIARITLQSASADPNATRIARVVMQTNDPAPQITRLTRVVFVQVVPPEFTESIVLDDSLLVEGGRPTGLSAPIVDPESQPTVIPGLDFQVTALTRGFDLELRWTVPTPADSPDWGRRLRILRKRGEWPSSFDDPDSFMIAEAVYGSEVSGVQVLEDTDLEPGIIYYYALFEFTATGVWQRDDQVGLDSAYPYDRWGACEYMYDSLPRGYRSEDAGVEHLYQFLCVVGALVDNLKTDAEHILTLFEIDSIHMDLIPLLDAKIAWPTWLAANGLQRRKETSEAVDLYKLKGRTAAYIQFLSGISDWAVEVFEGWRFVMFSNGLYDSTTPDFDDPDLLIGLGRLNDRLKYTSDQDTWRSLAGLVLEMTEIPGVSGPFTNLMVDRAKFLIEFFKASYAVTALVVSPVTEEQWDMTRVIDEYFEGITLTEMVPGPPVETDIPTAPQLSLFTSNDNPGSLTNQVWHRTFHSYLLYGGPPTPPADVMTEGAENMTEGGVFMTEAP